MTSKKTLLEIVQYVLSSLDSDEVNSINDTVEAQQVAKLVETAYYDLIARSGLQEHFDLFELEASGDSNLPTVMYRPERIRSIEWLKYNKTDTTNNVTANFILLNYISPKEMLDVLHNFNVDESAVGDFTLTIGGDNIEFYYRNDKHPDYYTTFDDRTFIFDSFFSNDDSTLQKSKTLGYGEVGPSFTMADDFEPDLDEKQFALLLNAVKVTAFAELKQTAHAVAGGNMRKQWISMQKEKSAIPPRYFDQLPNYARRVR